MARRFAGVILAAGQGTRMRSRTSKVLFPLLGRPLLESPLRLLRDLGCERTVVVVGHAAAEIKEALAEHPVCQELGVEWALQDPPRGTGDATQIALRALAGFDGPVVILNGDLPLLQPGTIEAMLDAHAPQSAGGAAAGMTLMTLELADPSGYGRIIRGPAPAGELGPVVDIVEEADATPEQCDVSEVNGGVYIVDREATLAGLDDMDAAGVDNAQDELYLPPVVTPLREGGRDVRGWALPPSDVWELQQVNNRVELAKAAEIRRAQIIVELQLSGVTVVDPGTTYIEEDVSIGQDTVVLPSSVIMSGVQIGRECQVGPFAYLRKGTVMADGAEVGNFTEVKNTYLGERSKAKHLSYLGDGVLGSDVNVGAGTIFANYDGKDKHRTELGDGVFVGSGTVFVAPVSVGEGGRTGAGAVVTGGTKVGAGETVVGVPARPVRAKQMTPDTQRDSEKGEQAG
ncbi:MAG: NTP transferase domain-containing protein [Planctomycetota bacterium]